MNETARGMAKGSNACKLSRVRDERPAESKTDKSRYCTHCRGYAHTHPDNVLSTDENSVVLDQCDASTEIL